MSAIRPDRVINAAVKERFAQLPPADQLALAGCAETLRDEIRGMGQTSAREVLYQIGRLLVLTEERGKLR